MYTTVNSIAQLIAHNSAATYCCTLQIYSNNAIALYYENENEMELANIMYFKNKRAVVNAFKLLVQCNASEDISISSAFYNNCKTLRNYINKHNIEAEI